MCTHKQSIPNLRRSTRAGNVARDKTLPLISTSSMNTAATRAAPTACGAATNPKYRCCYLLFEISQISLLFEANAGVH
jgi:hypothetical protein